MNKVTKAAGFGEYRVTDAQGAPMGTFFFSRSWTKGRVSTTCIVRTASGSEYRTSHCYFADAREDAVNGNLFNQS